MQIRRRWAFAAVAAWVATAAVLLTVNAPDVYRDATVAVQPAGREDRRYSPVDADASGVLLVDREADQLRAVDPLGRTQWVEEERHRDGAYATCLLTCAGVVLSSSEDRWRDLRFADPQPVEWVAGTLREWTLPPTRKMRVLAGRGEADVLLLRWADGVGAYAEIRSPLVDEPVVVPLPTAAVGWAVAPDGAVGALYEQLPFASSARIWGFRRGPAGWEYSGLRTVPYGLTGMCVGANPARTVLLTASGPVLDVPDARRPLTTDLPSVVGCRVLDRGALLIGPYGVPAAPVPPSPSPSVSMSVSAAAPGSPSASPAPSGAAPSAAVPSAAVPSGAVPSGSPSAASPTPTPGGTLPPDAPRTPLRMVADNGVVVWSVEPAGEVAVSLAPDGTDVLVSTSDEVLRVDARGAVAAVSTGFDYVLYGRDGVQVEVAEDGDVLIG